MSNPGQIYPSQAYKTQGYQSQFETALLDCIDYLSMGALSQRARHKLIKKVLIETYLDFEQYRHQNEMRKAYGEAPWPYLPERAGISQLFHYCYHQIIKGGNPGAKLALIQSAIFDSPLFRSYRPNSDESKSRRGGLALPIEDLTDLEPD